jgi:hypothetical protein
MQTKPWQKSSWKTLIPTMKQVKKESAIIALSFLEIYRFLTPKKIRILQKKIYLITIFDFFQIKLKMLKNKIQFILIFLLCFKSYQRKASKLNSVEIYNQIQKLNF